MSRPCPFCRFEFVIPLIYVLTDRPNFASYPFSQLATVLGTLVLISATYLLYRAHRDLGRRWSITLEIRDGHSLITNGIYEKLRHPMYSSFWLWALSQALLAEGADSNRREY